MHSAEIEELAERLRGKSEAEIAEEIRDLDEDDFKDLREYLRTRDTLEQRAAVVHYLLDDEESLKQIRERRPTWEEANAIDERRLAESRQRNDRQQKEIVALLTEIRDGLRRHEQRQDLERSGDWPSP